MLHINEKFPGIRRLKIKIIGTILLANVIIVSSATCLMAASKGIVNSDGVSARVSASADAQVAAELRKGDSVSVAAVGGDWFRVSAGGGAAFVSKAQVTLTSVEGTVNEDGVNLRREPSIDGEIVAQVNAGASVQITAQSDDFYRVEHAGETLYIHSDYVYCPLIEYLDKDAVYTGAEEEGRVDGETHVVAEPSTGASYGTAGGYAVVTAESGLNLRKNPSTDSDVLLQLPQDAVFDLIQAYTTWHLVSYKGITGFVAAEFVRLGTGAKPASAVEVDVSVYVQVTESAGVNLRSEPSTSSAVITAIPAGDTMDMSEAGLGWHKVNYEGRTGYVSTQYVTVKQGKRPDNSAGTKVVNYAKQFLGVRYVWGGTNLSRGVDCSGFTYSVYRHFGITLYRTSREQIKNGSRVSQANLKQGDLVFFGSGGYISHVGMYIGGGQFIHAASGSKYCVTISSLYEAYYSRRYIGATRILS